MQDGSLSSTSYSDGTTLFLAGQAGMMLLGSWWAQEYTSEDVSDAVANWDYDYSICRLLKKDFLIQRLLAALILVMVFTKNCENPDLAWKALVSFATGEGAQEIANDMNNHLSYPNIEPDTKRNGRERWTSECS